jgi:carbon-monoxide dehydrogenase medium subunit
VADFAPIIPAALRHVGHPANRNRGTFGGSVAHADPAAELPAVLLALGAELVASGPGGERVIGADDFFVTYYTTVLAADEVLTEVRLPQRYDASRTAWSFLELARRQGDFAVGGTALVAEVDGDGLVTSARVCLLGVADRPVRARQAEDFLVGKRLGDEAVAREAGQLAAGDLTPVSDVHGSAQYRKEVAAVLVARAAVDSATRLEGGR